MKKLLAIILMLLLVATSAMAEGGLTFTTVDMDGNEVTEAIFADYDITMINIWATWCGYCIQEMPAFPELKNMLPENANMITICEDAELEPELTREILDYMGANFVTLQADLEIYEQILSKIHGFPTTIFVDSEGKQVGEAIVGVPTLDLDQTANAYYNAIMLRLETMK